MVDIYMPDFKYTDPEMAFRYSKAKDYTTIAKAVIKEMHQQVGDLVIDMRGIATRGFLVRNLVLPENIAGTAEVVHFIADEISKNTYVNIRTSIARAIRRMSTLRWTGRITSKEFTEAVKFALKAGLIRLYGVTV